MPTITERFDLQNDDKLCVYISHLNNGNSINLALVRKAATGKYLVQLASNDRLLSTLSFDTKGAATNEFNKQHKANFPAT